MSTVLLWLATIATFAFIAWLATPLLDEWPKGTRLLAVAALACVTLAAMVHAHSAWLEIPVFLGLMLLAGLAVGARDRRVARGDGDQTGKRRT